MPVARVYERSIERDGTTRARFQAGDFGESGVGRGLQAVGRAGQQLAGQLDDVEDVKARIEANNLLVEHSEITRQIGNGVKQTLGDGAEAAAEKGITDLEDATRQVLGKASPRARLILEPQLGQRNVVSKDGFLDHGFGEKVKAFDTSAVAANQAMLDEAADEPDEQKALALLRPVMDRNAERARFYGHGSDWEALENRKYVSEFFKSRALKLAIGESGSAKAAVEYATANRKYLSDDDYLSIVSSYNNAALDEVAMEAVYGGGEPSATVAGEQTPAGVESQGPTRALDFNGTWSSWYVPQEGRSYAIDNNGAAVKYGINAAAHPGEDIKGMTEGRAKSIIKSKYWDKMGIDSLPPAIGAMAFDTAVIAGTTRAKALLKESGGDPDRFMSLRKSFLAGLSRKDPKKYPPGTWDRRNRELEAFSDRQGGDGTPLNVTPTTSMEGVTQAVMARTDIGLALKRRIISTIEQRRTDIIQERNLQESEAQRTLTDAALALGDGFTDIKQLPQSAWMAASPSARASFTDMARGNKENKPLSPELAAYINFVEVSDPRKFASKEFRQEIIEKGAPLATVRQVSQRQGQIAGAIASAKPDPVADGQLWSIARPAFEAAGLLFDTFESSAKKPAERQAERTADYQQKTTALKFLREMAQHWSIANPGKKPDEATVRGWVGYSLRQATPDKKVYQLQDGDLYNTISIADRNALIAEFKRHGIEPTVELMARAYRRARAINTGPQ